MREVNLSGVSACENCDYVQDQEHGLRPKPRVLTERDHAFNSEMRRREAAWYTTNKRGE